MSKSGPVRPFSIRLRICSVTMRKISHPSFLFTATNSLGSIISYAWKMMDPKNNGPDQKNRRPAPAGSVNDDNVDPSYFKRMFFRYNIAQLRGHFLQHLAKSVEVLFIAFNAVCLDLFEYLCYLERLTESNLGTAA